jgi:uncharacterized protein (DUF1330 family)
MGKGYFIVTYRNISNPEKWAAYSKLAAPAIQRAGGKFIVRGNPSKVFEQGLKERVVIVEFDNVHKAWAAHHPPPSQVAGRALGAAPARHFRIVEGLS